jgi:hypothetical protein
MSSKTPAPRKSRSPRKSRIGVEPLESRRLLTSWLVATGGNVQTVSDQIGSVTFTVRAMPGDTPGPDVPIQVSFDTLDTTGTAVPNIDYTPVHETLTLPVGTSQASVTIPIFPDAANTHGRSIVVSVDGSPYPASMPNPAGPPSNVSVPTTDLGGLTGDSGPTQNAIVYVVHQPDSGVIAAPLVAPTNPSGPTQNAIVYVVHQPDSGAIATPFVAPTNLGVPAQNPLVAGVQQPAHAPLMVVGSRLLTRRGRITGFVLEFNADMNKASVENLNNYEILSQRPPLTRVLLTAAAYDPATRSVTLTPAHAVPRASYLLEHPDPPNPLETPITDTSGLALDGNGDGVPDGGLTFKFPFPGHPRGLNLGIPLALPRAGNHPRGRGPKY